MVQDNRANAESEARKYGATDEEINDFSSDELFDWIAAKKREARRFLGSDADSSDDDDDETELPTNRQGAQQGNVSKRRLFRYTGKMQGLGMAWFIFEKKDYTEEEFRSLIAHLELNEPWKFVQQNGGQMKEGNGEWAQIGINSYHSVGDKWLSSDFTKAEICLCGQKPDEATVLCKLKCVFPGHSEADYANGVRQCFKCFDIATAYSNGAQDGEAEARRAEREAKKKAEEARKAEEAAKKKAAEEAAKKKAAEEAAKKRKSLLGKRKAPEPAPEPEVVQNLAQSKERLENFSTKLVANLENIQKTYMQEMNNSMQTVMKTVNEQMNNIMQTAMKNAKERMNNSMQTVMKNAKERMNTVMENAKEEANAAVKNAKEGLQHVAQTSMEAEVQDVTEEMREKEKAENTINLLEAPSSSVNEAPSFSVTEANFKQFGANIKQFKKLFEDLVHADVWRFNKKCYDKKCKCSTCNTDSIARPKVYHDAKKKIISFMHSTRAVTWFDDINRNKRILHLMQSLYMVWYMMNRHKNGGRIPLYTALLVECGWNFEALGSLTTMTQDNLNRYSLFSKEDVDNKHGMDETTSTFTIERTKKTKCLLRMVGLRGVRRRYGRKVLNNWYKNKVDSSMKQTFFGLRFQRDFQSEIRGVVPDFKGWEACGFEYGFYSYVKLICNQMKTDTTKPIWAISKHF